MGREYAPRCMVIGEMVVGVSDEVARALGKVSLLEVS